MRCWQYGATHTKREVLLLSLSISILSSCIHFKCTKALISFFSFRPFSRSTHILSLLHSFKKKDEAPCRTAIVETSNSSYQRFLSVTFESVSSKFHSLFQICFLALCLLFLLLSLLFFFFFFSFFFFTGPLISLRAQNEKEQRSFLLLLLFFGPTPSLPRITKHLTWKKKSLTHAPTSHATTRNYLHHPCMTCAAAAAAAATF